MYQNLERAYHTVLFNEQRIDLSESCEEYVTVGVDSISYKPVVRIYGASTFGTATHISFLGKRFWLFISKLREILNGRTWSSEILQRSGFTLKTPVTVEALKEENYNLRSEYGNTIISRVAAYEIAYEKSLKINHFVKAYMNEYRSIKPSLVKVQWYVYQKFATETKDRLREYFEKLVQEKCRDLDKMRQYLDILC